MMYHTLALILKKAEWHEADWLITALTRDFGKIRLLTQGARKHGAKLQGHVEPGSITQLSFVSGRNGYRLTTARREEYFPELGMSLVKTRALHAVLQALDGNLFEDQERAPELFSQTQALLQALARAETIGAVRRLLVWFHVRLLEFLGLLPAPDTPEAQQCLNLLCLGSRPLADVFDARIPAGMLEEELRWVSRRTASAVSVPHFSPSEERGCDIL